jgi:hypothetical protein
VVSSCTRRRASIAMSWLIFDNVDQA